jgi:aminomethyltransferase
MGTNKQTKLHSKHIQLGAKMAAFAGYDMPIQYSSVKDESLAVRKDLGIFDVSHMGEFLVEGPEAHAFVDYVITNDFLGAGAMKAVYSPLCRKDGTVIDDLIAYKLDANRVLVCVNASNIQKDWQWLNSIVAEFNCTMTDLSEETSLLAIQGPRTQKAFEELGLLAVGENPAYYSVLEKKWNNQPVTLARTGYTGEDGFEVFCSHDIALKLWDAFLALKAVPCGLASRDVLRLEVGYPLYGHELSDDWTPLDAGLKWTVKTSKARFIGKEALEALNPRFKLIKLLLENGIPRAGYNILDAQGTIVGKVTSGTHSVALEKGIALGLVEIALEPKDRLYQVQIRNQNYSCQLHTKPFVSGGHK